MASHSIAKTARPGGLRVRYRAQCAFYVDALGITDGAVLAVVGAAALSVAGHPVTREGFLAVWRQ
jgi:hypothetical protein